MSGSTYFDSFRDGCLVAVQLLLCGVLPPGLIYIYIYIYIYICVYIYISSSNIQSASEESLCGFILYRIEEEYHINPCEWSMYGYCNITYSLTDIYKKKKFI